MVSSNMQTIGKLLVPTALVTCAGIGVFAANGDHETAKDARAQGRTAIADGLDRRSNWNVASAGSMALGAAGVCVGSFTGHKGLAIAMTGAGIVGQIGSMMGGHDAKQDLLRAEVDELRASMAEERRVAEAAFVPQHAMLRIPAPTGRPITVPASGPAPTHAQR